MQNTAIIKELRRQSADWLTAHIDLLLEHELDKLPSAACASRVVQLLDVQKDRVTHRFTHYIDYEFDSLMGQGTRKFEPGDYPDPRLVDAGFLEAANAMEGMVNHARNTCIKALINFNTRLDTLLPRRKIDETNSPLDPDRIASAFVDALAPLSFDPGYRLPVYRCFNQVVLRPLGELLEQLNRTCIGYGVLPELVVEGRRPEFQRNKRASLRPTDSPLERAFPESPAAVEEASTASSAQLFATIRMLLGTAGGDGQSATDPVDGNHSKTEVVVPTAALTARQFAGSLVSELGLMPVYGCRDMSIVGREVVLVTRHRLIQLLDEVQARMFEEVTGDGNPCVDHRLFTRLLGRVLLDSSIDGTLNAISATEFDLLLTTSLLYESFWHDLALVDPVRELIAATQVVMMKIALHDPGLFTRVSHPARYLLNEVAGAGVGSLATQDLYEDPLYVKLESLLIRLVMEYDGKENLLEELCQELPDTGTRNAVQPGNAPGVGASSLVERDRRIDEIHDYVAARIRERTGEALHPVVDKVVNQHYHRFLVNIVQRDGPGSSSWLLVMKILDLLLWTVNGARKPGDRSRFERLKALLQPNLRKALICSGLDGDSSDALLADLQKVQEASFQADCNIRTLRPVAAVELVSGCSEAPSGEPASGEPVRQRSGTSLARPELTDTHFLEQVDKLPVGSWFRFQLQGDESISCTLAARLYGADKLVFVNRKGVRVVEKTRAGLARELRDGTVKIISDWPLFERGMESVIARLRSRR